MAVIVSGDFLWTETKKVIGRKKVHYGASSNQQENLIRRSQKSPNGLMKMCFPQAAAKLSMEPFYLLKNPRFTKDVGL